MTASDRQQIDVVIAGGGFAGLALGIALRQALGESFAVTVADPTFARGRVADTRASAIAAAARRLFQTIGVWERVADDAQPILDMVVTDSRLEDVVRPAFLSFEGEIAHDEPFAHMIENGPLLRALMDKAAETGVDLRAASVTEFSLSPSPGSGHSGPSHHIDVTTSDNAKISARLLVGADGARSAIRERAGIVTYGWEYGQSGIVTTVAHERDHHGRAEEHFLPAGPFAILPLKGRRSSLVWTEETHEAERIIALGDEEFHAEVERRFGLHLGELKAEGPRRAFPLGLAVARSFIAERIALVGDAAHIIHPIAGQGLNMGLKDVAALAEAIVDAARLGLDPGGAGVLDQYQRWRRFDTMAMGIATDGLNRLFSNRSDILRALRDVGMGLVDRAPALKQIFIREAAGLVGDVPRLLRGEAL
jgi:2-octaprenyl-6-methoxyphenol hydroxylase